MRLRTAILVIIGSVAVLFPSARGMAQNVQITDEAKSPRFEVASVKPNKSGQSQMMIATPPSGLVRATNANARLLIRYAFNVQDFLIFNAPDWTVADHFDVVAKAPVSSPEAQTREMFRALLVDRFRLTAHTEAREMPVDVLTLAERTPGPNMKASPQLCDNPPCHARASFGHVEGRDVPVAELASALTLLTRRVVVDRTGLAGGFDWTLDYTPDAIALQPSLRSEFPSVDPDGPALATALRQQLGIKMQTTRDRVDVLVIDHIERPDPD